VAPATGWTKRDRGRAPPGPANVHPGRPGRDGHRGVAYVIVALAVVLLATRNLTAQIDENLASTLAQISRGDVGRPPGGGGFDAPPPRVPFGAPVIVWTQHPDGTVTCNRPDAILPAAYYGVRGPVTVAIGTASVRIEGAPAGDNTFVVVGQTTESVSQAQGNLVVSELIIGPLLLLAVFLGAVAIGRRVAAPIELARRRQLEFTADASHELRTPLSVIEANTSLALSRDRDVGWYRSTFARLDGETRRMRRLLDDMLWLARFDALGGAPASEPVDLGLLAAQTVDRFRAVAEARALALTVDTGPVKQVVTAPPEWLDRLVGVLLDNACKYSPEGGTVRVSVGEEGSRARLTVDDSGPGIPPEERVRAFDRFHRATDQGSGAGLGLAIADAIVRATKGHWRIGTSPAGGSSMTILWPRTFPTRRQGGRGGAAVSEPAPVPSGGEVAPTGSVAPESVDPARGPEAAQSPAPGAPSDPDVAGRSPADA
jgi:signal transduction histidine kinase